MAIEHDAIPDGERHEPKGITTAAVDEAYIADGVTSGAWKTAYTSGFEDFNDSGSSQSLTNGVWVDLQNDAGGAFTNSTYRLPSLSTAVWDSVNDEFDFSTPGLALGDTIDLRVDVVVTTSGANHEIALRLDLAHGTGSEYSLEIDRRTFKTAGTFSIVKYISIYMGDTATLNNPCKIAMLTDGTGDTVVVNGWYVRTVPQKIVWS